MRFFVGLHQPSDAQNFSSCMVSVNRLRGRKSDFLVSDWILDSGAFTEISRYGEYRFPVEQYAGCVRRWGTCGNLLAAVTQDYMCEPFILQKTGKTVAEHQQLTVDRYDDLLRADTGVTPIMPVLQGYEVSEYLNHLRLYAGSLYRHMWVGVGSICKRNTNPEIIEKILRAIKLERPDLRLHGFGLKYTALINPAIRALLYSADSMAWSFAARREGRDANDWKNAAIFSERINLYALQEQRELPILET